MSDTKKSAQEPQGDSPARNNELQAERAKLDADRVALETEKMRLDVAKIARSHGVELSDDDLKQVGTREKGLELVLQRKASAEAERTNPRNSVATDISVGVESFDKIRDAAVNALLQRAGLSVDNTKLQGNPFAGRRSLDMVRRFALACGHREANDWSDFQICDFALRRGEFSRSVNVNSSMFDTYVLANAMDKAVALGFTAFGQNATYQRWTRTRQVSDFKTVTGAALDVGNLVKTVENMPFPELTKAEFGYTAALSMWGVTAKLSEQTLVNDDLGEFVGQIFRSGQIANRTIEKEVYAQLEAATWTNNTTSGTTLGSAASPVPGGYDVGRKAFINKTGPSGEKLGNVPRFLIHTPDAGIPAKIALGKIINYAGVAGVIDDGSVQLIEAPYLAGTATTYYLAADPNLADTLVLLMLSGITAPRIVEFDVGAVAGRAWKIYMPFTAKPVITQVGSTYYAPGLQQCTA